ncbi:rhodanese-related sulfurtransferase [Kitasatospora sp. SolWspMP-SS2h]|uniref:rhodanese-like domain-containing protein n=1 Tax=Kitasatospora sp. SolWspMP-SS2h TaxID=1305729 RepID=UPI000DC005AC|nr:rhodanese-like domain-containing protein [Kitasatospora sp. SolWspMP-SS2h]RAJ46422.1 rhodanese-related sulfurtransferase [Kitasatospora sp. SolWspMP-SS2h]
MARSPQPPAPEQIDPAEAHRLAAAGAALLLDVREPAEHAEVHAPGALLVPLGDFGDFDGDLGGGGGGGGDDESGVEAVRAAGGGRPVLAVCRSGNRSQRAAELLNARGVPTVNVVGGMRAWQEAGLPTHRDGCRCGGTA